MSNISRVIVAIGLLVSASAQAREDVSDRVGPTRTIELCQAFPWDEPVEQTFSVASVINWRRATRDARVPRRHVHVSDH